MEYFLIGVVTLIGAGLTLFSGFGLGTLLMPVFALFFPVEVAIGLTTIVHFANNLIKIGFFYKKIDWLIVAKFGVPSVFAAFLGAYLLLFLFALKPLAEYYLFGNLFLVTPIKLTVACLLIVFSVIELFPKVANVQFSHKYLFVGGILSGFFGGLSGNQGALRSAFLIKAGLTKEVLVGTGVAIACIVDFTRLSVYSQSIFNQLNANQIPLILIAVFSAFLGVFFGNRLLKKVTIKIVQMLVSVMILFFAFLLGMGIL